MLCHCQTGSVNTWNKYKLVSTFFYFQPHPSLLGVVRLIHSDRQIYRSSFFLLDMKWNESGFRPPLCTYRLNWARRTSWGWWDDWDDTVLQTQDSKFEPWRSEAEHATSRSRRLPTILTFTRGWGRNIICFFQTAETGNRTPNSGVLTITLGLPPFLLDIFGYGVDQEYIH